MSRPCCRPLSILLLAAALFIGAGCASVLEVKNDPPEVLLKQAQQYVSVKNFEDAKTSLDRLLEDYPDSRERPLALLLRAEVQYREEEFEEARFRFGRFLEQYPAHPLADRAMFLKAMCDYRLRKMELRDQTSTRNAIEGFDQLARTYPDSRYRAIAEEKKRKCLETLARNQMEIGKFYFRTSAFQAAIARFKKILETYPNQNFLDEAIFLLGECHFMEQNYILAKDYYLKLLQEYPRSGRVKEARLRLLEIK